MNAHALPASIERADRTLPILAVTGPSGLVVRAGTVLATPEGRFAFEDDRAVAFDDARPGTDYAVRINAMGEPYATPFNGELELGGIVAGFHFAPGGNAAPSGPRARSGGDDVPAINPLSCWDAGFRPACPDPRGMALVERFGRRFWCDIYLLGVEHRDMGTSRFGLVIADGRSLPQAIDGKGRTKKLDYPTAVAIYAHHGKQLLGAEEFFAAAYGVTERSSADDEPETTALDAPRTSAAGIIQATGNMWIWGTDGDPEEPRPSLVGGSWISGGLAGSRFANLDDWPGNSDDSISARGRCDHLSPA